MSSLINKLYPSNHKTIFVLDHSPYFGISSDYPIELDPTDKSRGPGFIPIAPIFKSLWTSTIEAVFEYCRIVWDLFPDRKLIRVILSDVQAQSLNSWSQEEQNLVHCMYSLTSIGSHPPRQNADCSMMYGLCSALEAMCEPSALQSEKLKQDPGTPTKHNTSSGSGTGESTSKILNRCRIVAVTSVVEPGGVDKLKSHFHSELQRINKIAATSEHMFPIATCHLVIINVFPCSSKHAPTLYSMQHAETPVSALLSTELHCVKAGPELSNKLSHLIQLHYDLASTTVTGIPMKEEQNANSSANYDVEIFHPSEVHAALLKGNLADLATIRAPKPGQSYDTITLRWCTPRSSLAEMHAVTCMHRITPVEVNSRPSSCLIHFLLNGRSVNLELVRRVGGKVISHILTSHGGDIFMHTLATGRSILEDPPSISEGYGGRVTDYRITDFGILMRSNKLMSARRVSSADKLNEKMKTKVERQTMYWPLTISATYIYNNKQLFEPLLTLVQKEEISDAALIQCNQCVYNLVALEAKHEPLLPSNPGTRGKGPKRDEQYRQMWSELEHVVRINNRSENHAKLLQTLLDFKNKSPANMIADESKHTKIELNQALRELDIIKDMNSSSSPGSLERASVIRPTPPTASTDSPLSPPLSSRGKPAARGRSLLDICVNRSKASLHRSKRADFYGRLNAEQGPNGNLVSKLYVDLVVKDEAGERGGKGSKAAPVVVE
uniref:Protein asunder n=1 Tax=Cacopsylla melanoneura TaxID=428564 RepID=A0A8D9EME3_9HEMI